MGVLGKSASDEDPAVLLARQQDEFRRTQHRLHKQKRREAKLLEEQKRLQEESHAVVEEAESAAKDVKRLQHKLKSTIAAKDREMREMQVPLLTHSWCRQWFLLKGVGNVEDEAYRRYLCLHACNTSGAFARIACNMP